MVRSASRWLIVAAAVALAGAPVAAKAQGQTMAAQTQKGYELLRDGKSQEALTSFLTAIKLNSRDIAARLGAAQAYERLGKVPDATQQLRSLTDLSPRDPQFRLEYGRLLFVGGRPAEAVREFTVARHLAPGNILPELSLADVYRQQQRYDDARACLVDALGHDPDNPGIHIALARLAQQRQNWPAALAEAQAAVRLAPNAKPARLALCDVYNGMKHFTEAAAEAMVLLSSDPKDPDAHSALAVAYDGLGKSQDAVREYRTVLAADQTQPIVWGNLGWTLYGAGRYKEAIEASRKALALDKSLVYVRLNLGLIYACRKETDRSLAEYRAALPQAQESDLRSGIDDVKAALVKHPGDTSLGRALRFLEQAAAAKAK